MLMKDAEKTYKYRELKARDDATLAGIIRDNLEKYELDIPGTVYYDEGLDHLSDYYGTGDRKYYVLEDDNGAVLGGIGFERLGFMEETAELQKLYLADSAKRAGLGYELIALIEKKMSEAGYKYSYLETHDNLGIAIHLYEKCGYREIEKPKEVVHSAMNRFFKKAL
jgi:putative acetyltransferase